uniref:GTP-binding protein 10 n=1 Tax=Ciona intestinalis TaxID=7719 RepID=F6WS50_CIOIN
MVFLTRALLLRTYSKDFIDKLRIYVRGGTGGNGHPTLGGIGGRGGDVYLVGATKSDMTLKSMKDKYPEKRFVADTGQSSRKQALSGLNGASIYVQVPHGISIVDAANNQVMEGEISGSLDKLLVARGGRGGTRSTGFIPRPGQRRNLYLDLKLIADVGFVGFPNAGKSTLLSRISKAKPKIASYPFTTITPQIGVLEYPDFRKIQLADLPGLVEGAYLNKGRGHSFLKHIERTKLLLFVVDISGFQLSTKHQFRNAFETVQLLTQELSSYDGTLTNKPSILAVNKMDLPAADDLFNNLLTSLQGNKRVPNFHLYVAASNFGSDCDEIMKFKDVIPISAHTGEGTEKLSSRIREIIDNR